MAIALIAVSCRANLSLTLVTKHTFEWLHFSSVQITLFSHPAYIYKDDQYYKKDIY